MTSDPYISGKQIVKVLETNSPYVIKLNNSHSEIKKEILKISLKKFTLHQMRQTAGRI